MLNQHDLPSTAEVRTRPAKVTTSVPDPTFGLASPVSIAPRAKFAAACAFILTLVTLGSSASAATWRVHSTKDSLLENGTLRHAVANAVDGDTIVLVAGIGNKPILLNSEIELNKHLTIIGAANKAATISAGGASRVFRITETVNVLLQNIIITDGKSPEDGTTRGKGGGIYNLGTLTLNGVTLERNQSQLDGGAIYNLGNKLTLDNCILKENTCLNGGPDGSGGVVTGYGGAIKSEYGELTILNSQILNNAGDQGGAVFSYHNAVFKIQKSTFAFNTSTYDGGAISILNASSGDGKSCVIEDSALIGNQAGYTGGGIVLTNVVATVNRTEIRQNYAGSAFGGEAGGVYNWQSTSTFTDCIIDANTAKGSGGGIKSFRAYAYINTSQISNNIAQSGWGGGAFTDEGGISIKNSTVSNNTAGGGGGIVSRSSEFTSCDSTTIDGNIGHYNGGGIMCLSCSFQLKSSRISNNTAQVGGGGGVCAIYPSSSGESATIEDCVITENVAEVGGGIGLYAMAKVTCNQATITFNTATLDLGNDVFVEPNSTFTATNSVIGDVDP